MKSALQTEKQYLDTLDQRDRLTLISLGVVAIVSFVAPVIFRGILPSPAKSLSLLLSAGSSGAIGVVTASGKTQARNRFRTSIDAKQEKLLELYFAQDASVAKLTGDVVAHNQLLTFLGQYPPEQQIHYLKQWGLMGIAPFELMAALEMMRGAPVAVDVRSQAIAEHPAIALTSITQPTAEQMAVLPDGAELIQPSKLNDVNRYPVIMVVAGQGSGKTATIAFIFSNLDGYKVFASPKPITRAVQDEVDLVYGYSVERSEWLSFGKMSNTTMQEHEDLSWQVAHGIKYPGSMLKFLWCARRESMNRQLGRTENKAKWRLFYDEAAYTYSAGFTNPQDAEGKEEARSKKFVAGVLRDGFMNFRGQKEQLYIGCQVDSVETVGLKDMSKARDDAWGLYPGLEAIAAAERCKKFQLAEYLRDRVKAGYGIALLIKQDSIFEVIDLPTIKELDRYSEGDTTVPTQAHQPAPVEPIEPTEPGDIYQQLKQWQKQNPDAPDDRLAAEFKRLSGRSLNASGLEALKDLLSKLADD